MKFLFLCHNCPEYGTYFRAFQLGKQLVRKGHDVVLMLVSADRKFGMRRYDRDGVWIIECPHVQPFIPDKEDGWGFLDILLRCVYGLTHRIDVVVGFGHKPDIAVPSLILKYLKGVTYVTDWCDLWGEGGIFSVRGILPPRHRGTPPDRALVGVEMYLEKLVVRRANGVTVICTPIEKICAGMGVGGERLCLLRSGCDTEGITPVRKTSARKLLGLPRGRIIEYMGNYHQEAPFLFRSFQEICRAREDIHLLIVGPEFIRETDEDTGECLEGQRVYRALPEKVKERIVWAGKRPYGKLSPYLSAADILLLPMENTGLEIGRWPNKLCDYLAAGRPIAVTAIGDAGRFIGDRRCGVVSPPDIDAYCRAVLGLLDNSSRLSRLGRKARAVAEGELSWDRLSDLFLNFTISVHTNKERRFGKMRKVFSTFCLALYTLFVIVFEGVFLLVAYCALRLGWEPKKNVQ